MDQHACLLCESEHFLLLDCLDRTYRHIVFPADSGIHIFLIDTRVQHKLTDSDYNTRAAECRRALKLLQGSAGFETLRDISVAQLHEYSSLLGPLLMQRIAFVLRENARVLSAVETIQASNWQKLGQLLYESHSGLRDDYEVSCAELDFLVEAVSPHHGILGARMMGGGFGGCTINLATHAPDQSFKDMIGAQYKRRFGWECTFIDVRLSESATVQVVSSSEG